MSEPKVKLTLEELLELAKQRTPEEKASGELEVPILEIGDAALGVDTDGEEAGVTVKVSF